MLVLKDGAIVAELDGDDVNEERLMAALATERPAEAARDATQGVTHG
jgi:ABC-type sugar transport system ATPase subunit